MTVNEMITSFSQYYDKMTNLAAPGYEDSEILLFLNNAQDNFIKERMFGDNFQPPAFEDNKKRVMDLQPLIRDYLFQSTSISYFARFEGNKCIMLDLSILSNPVVGKFVMYPVGLSAKIWRTEPTINGQYMECDLIKTQDARKFETTSYNKPYFKYPKYFISEDMIYLIYDAYTTSAGTGSLFNFIYVKNPTALVAGDDCDLEDYTHQEIVDMAVREAMQVSQDQRYETKVVEEKNVKTQ